MLPRDQPGSVELTEGTGPILDMCSCGAFLEIYKEDTTFRFETPETIDPDRTNPNAPFVAMVSERIGTSNPIVARVLLQGRDIVQSAFLPNVVDKEKVIIELHDIKEALITCFKASTTVNKHVRELSEQISHQGVATDRYGRTLPSLPQVPDLEPLCTQFLIAAKRAVRSICTLPSLFWDLDRVDTNFDHLAKRLQLVLDEDHPVTMFVRDRADIVRYLTVLRNGQEHPTADERTHVDNFRVLPDGTLRAPSWYLTGQDPAAINVDMAAGIEWLVEITEDLVVYLVDSRLGGGLPYALEVIPDAEIDPKKPIRYRLTIALSPSPHTAAEGDED
jgi:hypothetical protein